MSDVDALVATLEHTLRSRRFHAGDEASLQQSIAGVLSAAGLPFEREVCLETNGADRNDFLVGGCVGLEIKVAGPVNGVARQLQRYAGSSRVEALLLATTLRKHESGLAGASFGGKQIRVVRLAGGFL